MCLSFKRYNFKYSKNLSKIRLTIDEKKDLKRINFVFNSLKNKKRFGINDIDKLYNKNKNVFRTDGSHDRNEGGYLNSGQKLWKRAYNIIPGGNMLLSKRPEMFAPNQWPTYYSKAKGCNVWDLDNTKYIDRTAMSLFILELFPMFNF